MTDKTFTIGGDLTVRRIGFGAMRLSDGPDRPADPAAAPIWRGPAERAQAVAVLRRAVDLGVNLIDTADSYALGANEELIAEALHPYPRDLLITTKVGVTRPSPGEWAPLGHPAYLRQQTELSLRRLRTDHIDLLHLHRIDPAIPLADQFGALKQLRDEGKVRHIGVSEASVAQLKEAADVVPIAAVQNLYNVTSRGHDEVVDHAAAHDMAFLAFFPIGVGAHSRADGPVGGIARKLGVTPSRVALAWLLRRSPNILPIPGTTDLDHLADNLAALDLTLPERDHDALTRMT